MHNEWDQPLVKVVLGVEYECVPENVCGHPSSFKGWTGTQNKVELKVKAEGSICYPLLSWWVQNHYSLLVSVLTQKTKVKRLWGWSYFNRIPQARQIFLQWSTHS